MLLSSTTPSILIVGIILTLIGLFLGIKIKRIYLAYIGLCIIDIGIVAFGFSINNESAYMGTIRLIIYNSIARFLGFIALYKIVETAKNKHCPIGGIIKELPYTVTVFALSMYSAIEISPFFTLDAKYFVLFGTISLANPLEITSYALTSYLSFINLCVLIITIFFVHNFIQGKNYHYQKSNICHDIKSSSIFQHIALILLIGIGLFAHDIGHYLEQFIPSENLIQTIYPDFGTIWNNETLTLYVGAFLVFILGSIAPFTRKPLVLILTITSCIFSILNKETSALSYLFTTLTAFMAIIVSLYSFSYIKKIETTYYSLLLLMFGSVIGLLSHSDYGSIFVFWELMTITSYALIAFEDTPKAHYAAKKYLLMSGIAALTMLPALLVICANDAQLLTVIKENHSSAVNITLYIAIVAILVGVGVKAGIVPGHSWLPDAHPAAPASISAPLSGILTKAGIYGIFTFYFVIVGYNLLSNSFVCPFFKLPSIGVLLLLLGIITMFYGEIKAYQEKEIKRLFAYSTIGQIGEICMTIALFTYLSASGALFHVINHAIMKDLIFLATGVFLLRSGLSKIEDLKGLGKAMPFTATCIVIGLLSIMGVPPFTGFNSKFAMVYALADYNPYLPILMLIAGLIGCVYYARIIRVLIFEKYEGPEIHDASPSMKIAMGILAGLCIILGLYPQFILDIFVYPATTFIAQLNGLRGYTGEVTTLFSILTINWQAHTIVLLLGSLLPCILRKNPLQCGIASVFVLGFASLLIIINANNYDTLSFLFALAITVIGSLSALYSIGYMEHGHAQWRYYASFLCMCAGLTGIATANTIFGFFFYWEIMSSWTLYFVIIHEETQESLREGFKYFFFNMVGASVLFLGVALTIYWLGTNNLAELGEAFMQLNAPKATIILALLAAGFIMKAAQLPFRIDIQMHPRTAPTPVSGYISSVLLKSALFGLFKIFIAIGGASMLFATYLPQLMEISLYIGAITIVMAAAFAVFQNDIKLVLIYSTVSQLGYMVVGISLGTSLGVAGGLLHLVNHMLFKDLLFLVAGVIIAQTHIYSMNQMGGLGLKMPKTLAVFAIAAVCLIGLPPSSGFTSKWIIYHALMEQGHVLPAILSLVGSVLTLAYMVKFLHSVFLGQVKPSMEKVTEAPKTMLIPMMILAIGCIIASFFPGLILMVINNILQSVGLQTLDVAPWGINSGKGAWNATLTGVLLVVIWFVAQKILKKATKTQRITTIHTCGISAQDVNPTTNANDIYSTGTLFGTWRENNKGA